MASKRGTEGSLPSLPLSPRAACGGYGSLAGKATAAGETGVRPSESPARRTLGHI